MNFFEILCVISFIFSVSSFVAFFVIYLKTMKAEADVRARNKIIHDSVICIKQESTWEKDNIVSCDECRCLIRKMNAIKLSSTVQVYNYAAASGCSLQPFENKPQKLESIIEHYVCHRCKGESDKLEEKSENKKNKKNKNKRKK